MFTVSALIGQIEQLEGAMHACAQNIRAVEVEKAQLLGIDAAHPEKIKAADLSEDEKHQRAADLDMHLEELNGRYQDFERHKRALEEQVRIIADVELRQENEEYQLLASQHDQAQKDEASIARTFEQLSATKEEADSQEVAHLEQELSHAQTRQEDARRQMAFLCETYVSEARKGLEQAPDKEQETEPER